jgi:hypothetical protein
MSVPNLVHRFFHWTYSGVFIPVWFGTGVAMALADHFSWAYVFFVVFGFWTICSWLTSYFLNEQWKAIRKRPKKERHTGVSPEEIKRAAAGHRSRYILWKWGVTGVCVVVTGICLGGVRLAQVHHELRALKGILYAGNDPMLPTGDCHPSRDSLVVFLGDTVVDYSDKFPYSLVLLGSEPMFTVEKGSHGELLLTTTIHSRDAKVIADIRKGAFVLNPHVILDFDRPDKSTLIVRDDYGRTVLNVRYLNPRAVRLVGVFQMNPDGAIVIDNSGVRSDGNVGVQMNISETCFGNFNGFGLRRKKNGD